MKVCMGTILYEPVNEPALVDFLKSFGYSVEKQDVHLDPNEKGGFASYVVDVGRTALDLFVNRTQNIYKRFGIERHYATIVPGTEG